MLAGEACTVALTRTAYSQVASIARAAWPANIIRLTPIRVLIGFFTPPSITFGKGGKNRRDCNYPVGIRAARSSSFELHLRRKKTGANSILLKAPPIIGGVDIRENLKQARFQPRGF